MTRTYKAGGTLDPEENYYIHRKADDELLRWCLQGEYAYVFNASQTGKSSLIERIRRKLTEDGVRAVSVSLENIGQTDDIGIWFSNLLDKIARELELDTDTMSWWAARPQYTAARRWEMFFDEVVLVEIPGKVVIFLDEIDDIYRLPFRGDFLGILRLLYNARPRNTRLNRLTFILAGLARPRELLGHSNPTGDNIWKGVALGDLTEKEGAVEELAGGLGLETTEQRKKTLGWILEWTGGHPYLTQKLCARVQEQEWKESSTEKVDELVEVEFRNNPNETNLSYVERELTKEREYGVTRTAVLAEYERVLRGGRVRATNTAAQAELKQTGVVKVEDEWLRVRNHIYQEVFDNKWLKRRFRPGIYDWLRHQPRNVQWSLAILGIMFLTLVVAVYVAVDRQQRAEQFAANAIAQSNRAEAATTQMVAQQERAEKAAAQAIAERDRAEQLAREARSRELAAVAQARVNEHPSQGLLLALEALNVPKRWNEATPLVAEESLRYALANTGGYPVSEGVVRSIAMSPDGNILVTGSPDGTVRVWKVTDPTEKPKVIQVGEDWIEQVVFSPDSRWMATRMGTYYEDKVHLWNTENLDVPEKIFDTTSNDVGFSADGKLFAIAGDFIGIKVWGTSDLDGDPITLGEAYEYAPALTGIIFSPDNRWLIGTQSSQLFAYDQSHLDQPPIILANDVGIWTEMIFSPDGRWLVVGMEQSWSPDTGSIATARVWDMRDLARQPIELGDSIATANDIAFDTNGTRLAIAWGYGGYGKVEMWDMSRLGDKPIELAVDQLEASAVAFSPDGQWLAAGDDSSLRIWDATDLRSSATPVVVREYEASVDLLMFTPDRKKLVSASPYLPGFGTARVWDMPDLIASPIIWHRNTDLENNLPEISPNHRWLVDEDNSQLLIADLLNPNYGPMKFPLDISNTTRLEFSADSSSLTLLDPNGEAKILNLANLSVKSVQIDGQEHQTTISPIESLDRGLEFALSPNEHWLAITNDTEIKVWDLTNKALQPYELNSGEISILAIVFSPDNRWLAASGEDSKIRVWNLNQLDSEPKQLEGHIRPAEWLIFSSDSEWLLSRNSTGFAMAPGWVGEALLWNMHKLAATPIDLRQGYVEPTVYYSGFSPDGRYILTITDDNPAYLMGTVETIAVRDLRNENSEPLYLAYGGIDRDITSIRFSPDNRWFALGTNMGEVFIWDMLHLTSETSEPTYRLPAHDGDVIALAFSPDGNRLATTGLDSLVHIWDLGSATLVPLSLPRFDEVYQVEFSLDGRWLITWEDEAARLWDMKLDNLIDLACRIADRNLSREEWDKYFFEEPYRKTCEQWPEGQ